jgi:hypothetical protein
MFGQITKPSTIDKINSVEGGGIGQILGVMTKGLIAIAGIYALINIILAGYAFMSAGGDPKKVADAWAKIWQTILGLAVSAGAFVLAAIFSKLIFGDATILLKPTIPSL